jgi:hypothetical protein
MARLASLGTLSLLIVAGVGAGAYIGSDAAARVQPSEIGGRQTSFASLTPQGERTPDYRDVKLGAEYIEDDSVECRGCTRYGSGSDAITAYERAMMGHDVPASIESRPAYYPVEPEEYPQPAEVAPAYPEVERYASYPLTEAERREALAQHEEEVARRDMESVRYATPPAPVPVRSSAESLPPIY